PEFIRESVTVTQDGQVLTEIPGQDDPIQVGQLQLYRFVNPSGLSATGQNVFRETAASGEAIGGTPGLDGMGRTRHKFLEMSNVSVVSEMVNMIVAQRAYEMNSRAIQTSDTMLGIANGLKR
ncbi:MAG: flagellar hook-basal body complex protein, partial [Alkalispirochaeta sp.]